MMAFLAGLAVTVGLIAVGVPALLWAPELMEAPRDARYIHVGPQDQFDGYERGPPGVR